MRPVNLIPPEERRGELAPLRTGVLSYVIVGVLGLALLGVVAIVLTGNSISEKESDLASLEARKLAADQRAARARALRRAGHAGAEPHRDRRRLGREPFRLGAGHE